MSKLDEMIRELCPDGVEYVKLNSVCDIYDGTHSTPNYTESGVKFASVENIGNLYATRKYISEKDFEKYKIKPRIGDVMMTRIGSVGVCTVVDRNEALAFYVSLALLRPQLDKVQSRFLKYAIESIHGRKELRKRTLINAVPIKINKDDIGKVTIPLPPIEIQREIVRILDNFTNLTAELVKELTARKTQYGYYRNKFLDFESSVSVKTIGDICDVVVGGEPPTDCIKGDVRDSTHIYPVWGNGKEVYGYSGTYKIDRDAVVISSIGANTGAVYYKEAFFTPIIRLKVILPKDNRINARFLFHALSGTTIKSKSSSVPNMNANEIKAIKIPVPPLDVQNRIVNVLDNFEKICSDLNIGLPAEIEARQKQYEYYRDKLLTFKEVAAT